MDCTGKGKKENPTQHSLQSVRYTPTGVTRLPLHSMTKYILYSTECDLSWWTLFFVHPWKFHAVGQPLTTRATEGIIFYFFIGLSRNIKILCWFECDLITSLHLRGEKLFKNLDLRQSQSGSRAGREGIQVVPTDIDDSRVLNRGGLVSMFQRHNGALAFIPLALRQRACASTQPFWLCSLAPCEPLELRRHLDIWWKSRIGKT